MIKIGICDDNEKDQTVLCDFAKEYLDRKQFFYKFLLFQSGEEVLAYCDCEENERIDLLFLDIEMSGISGIEVKDRILKENKIWRLVFVSSYRDKVFESFGLKTLGFVVKPAKEQEICKWIDVVVEELDEERFLELKGLGELIRLEDVEYMEGNGSYTKIVLHPSAGRETQSILLSRKLGEIEKELEDYSIVRVHKSYLVNLMNVTSVNRNIELRDLSDSIPIGRTYREIVREEYRKYGKSKVMKRI